MMKKLLLAVMILGCFGVAEAATIDVIWDASIDDAYVTSYRIYFGPVTRGVAQDPTVYAYPNKRDTGKVSGGADCANGVTCYTYKITGLPPGEYYISATALVPPLESAYSAEEPYKRLPVGPPIKLRAK